MGEQNNLFAKMPDKVKDLRIAIDEVKNNLKIEAN
jgi:hypothetical protein